MDQTIHSSKKPYDIRERVLLFVLDVIAVFPKKRVLERPSFRSWSQLFDSASSAGAHLEEADAGSSHRHFTTLNRGALRKLREAKFWLRVILAGKLEGAHRVSNLTAEASELVAIVSAIVKTAEAKDAKNKKKSGNASS
jgi:four helix bundle protein